MSRVLLAALVCVAVWASGYRAEAVVAPSTIHGATHGVATDCGHAGNPARANDVWQNASAVVTVHSWRLDERLAELPAGRPVRASRIACTTSHATPLSPPALAHTFEVPLLI